MITSLTLLFAKKSL